MRLYSGVRGPNGGIRVSVINRVTGLVTNLPLVPSLRVRRITAQFDWGDAVAGASQLALAILLDWMPKPSSVALSLYQEFCAEVVMGWDRCSWTLKEEDLSEWVNQTVASKRNPITSRKEGRSIKVTLTVTPVSESDTPHTVGELVRSLLAESTGGGESDSFREVRLVETVSLFPGQL